MSNHSFFKHVPHPAKWLEDTLEEENISQRKLSFLIACDVSQLNRWKKGKETIPITYIEIICRSLCFSQKKQTML